MSIVNILKSSGGIIIISFVFIIISLLKSPSSLPVEGLNWWEIGEILFLTMGALFLLPLLLIKFVFKAKLSAYGFRLPENFPKTFFLSLLIIVLITPVMVFFATQKEFQNYYSLGKVNWWQFLMVSGFAALIYYFFEEFFFRGFLFFSLWLKVKYHSFWLTSLIFAILHLTKPPAEFLFSFFISLIFCYLSLKTKSFLPAAVIHFILAFILNFLVTFIWPIN